MPYRCYYPRQNADEKVSVVDKSERGFNFHKNTLRLVNELLAAAGKKSFAEVEIKIFMQGDEFTRLSDLYFSANLKSVNKL